MKNREFFIEHDGLRIHAKLSFPAQEKDTYPLLIIGHGYTGHMEERHITALAQSVQDAGFASLRTELYGHGMSDGTFKDHTIWKWVTQMMAVIDYARSLPFVDGLYLAGHSQGGLTAMLAGAAKRDMIDALLPLSPAIMIRDRAREGVVFGARFDPEHIPDEIHLPDGRVLSGDYARTAQLLPIEEAVRMYRKPVLIVHADTDETVPFSCASAAAADYACAQLVVIEGDTHCYDHRLADVTAAVTGFLTRMEDDRRQLNS